MKQKAFSLIEVIFVIAILSLIAIVALPKFKDIKSGVDLVKIKSDITLIRNGINEYKNKSILSNGTISLDSLDEDSELLFSKVLSTPILGVLEPKVGYWKKESNSKYLVFISSEKSLEFRYYSSKYTFDCNIDDEYCKELTQ